MHGPDILRQVDPGRSWRPLMEATNSRKYEDGLLLNIDRSMFSVYTFSIYLRIGDEINSPSCFTFCPSSALRKRTNTMSMRPFTRLEDEPNFVAIWGIYFVPDPYHIRKEVGYGENSAHDRS